MIVPVYTKSWRAHCDICEDVIGEFQEKEMAEDTLALMGLTVPWQSHGHHGVRHLCLKHKKEAKAKARAPT